MYEFGFYWDHISGFKEYVAKELPLKNVEEFENLCRDFKASNKSMLNNIMESNKTIHAFGIELREVCCVDLAKGDPSAEDKTNNRKHWFFSEDTMQSVASLEKAGTYIWRFGDEYRYVGETDNLRRRITQYSNITQKIVDGNSRSTNRKINSEICNAILHDKIKVRLYFYETAEHHKDIEQYLLQFRNAQDKRFDLNM